MCTSDFDERAPQDETLENTTSEPKTPATPESDVDSPFKGTWDRRTFLKAAALGTAAAALFSRGQDGWKLGGLSASAHDISGNPCTANDVRIESAGTIANEPCVCDTEFFNAEVVFEVDNHTGSDRYCVTLHLPAANGIAAQDVILVQAPGEPDPGSTVLPAKSQQETFRRTRMVGIVTGFPCGLSEICFGDLEQGEVLRGRCSGPCATIGWFTSAQQTCAPNANTPPGQCRHQGLCIVGFGATLACVEDCSNGSCGDESDSCDLDCGEDLHLCLSVDGGHAPYVFEIYGPDADPDSDAPLASFGPTNNTSHCFTIDASEVETGTYIGRVHDSRSAEEDCYRDDSVDVTVQGATTTLEVVGTPGCDGIVTFQAGTEEGLEGCSFLWEIDGEEVEDVTGDTLTYDPCELGHLDGENHTVTATASCGDCPAEPASLTINQCVETSIT